jgi:hypothetical protein
VASYCSKCGAEVHPDHQTCLSCGTPVAAAASVVAPVPVAAQPAPVPAKSGSSALKIILIIIAIFIGLGILGAGAFGFFVWRVAHAIHVSSSNSGKDGEVTLNTPGGSFTANTSENFTAADLGTDIYPGATTGKGSMRITLPSGSSVTAVFVTSDSKEQVVSYYKEKFGSSASVFDSANSAMLTSQKGNQESIMVTVTPNQSQYNGKTQITIIHTISNKPS